MDFREEDLVITGSAFESGELFDAPRVSSEGSGGALIINADDWGRDRETTDRINDCTRCRTVSSVSAMVFMEDSERAARIAQEQDIDCGLHLNFTTSFSASRVPARLVEHQSRTSRYLLSHRFAPVVFHPGLSSSFEYVVATQLDEYRRIYGDAPRRLDGHHHMHLCANVLLRHLLPTDTIVRRNFTFGADEKGICNRLYRRAIDHRLGRRHQLCDFLFQLVPLQPPDRLKRIVSLARQFAVEVETHPPNPDEYRFLMGGGMAGVTDDVRVARHFVPRKRGSVSSVRTAQAPQSGSATERCESPLQRESFTIKPDDLILVTGANGFIGSKVVENLLDRGFRNLRCFVRNAHSATKIEAVRQRHCATAQVEVIGGNLLSPEDCAVASEGVKVVYHLAAGRGEKSYPEAFANSVITTRNLLEACVQNHCLLRFVNVSSFAVYSNRQKPGGRLLDESCPIEARPELRGEAYCFAKIKQDDMVTDYSRRFGVPYVIVRPGYVFGPGKEAITDRVGIDTFGVFFHCGGSNRIPFTYIDNCADAIVMAGLKKGIEGQVFNVVDDDLPTSRRFLRLYKRNVKKFRSLYLPHALTLALSYLWEQYSIHSQGQLPPTFNCRRWHSYWKKTDYSNSKIKALVGWVPRVSMAEGLDRYFAGCRDRDERVHA